MPYTPPAAQSPASSRTSTPSISRNPSYSSEIGSLTSPTVSHRPNLPRSLSSATYLSKHRRSPSVTSPSQVNGNQSSNTQHGQVKDAESQVPLRQAQPVLNNLIIPNGAMISPPDSSENSDGDETHENRSRRQEVQTTWNELQQAVRSMSLKRDPSPVKVENTSNSEPVTQVTSPSSLTPEARKISHSRSSTETAIAVPKPGFAESPSGTSASEESGDEDEDGPLTKPPLVRKKSGELVKPALRPSSRRRYSSMPGTPTYSKSVHFNDNGNQTRHFLQVDKPSAVSATTSPAETYDGETEFPFESRQTRVEWTIKLANFPDDNAERKLRPVWTERLSLSSDNKSLVGQVAVANICFSKTVVARFTLDYWKTTSEVSAEFNHDVRKQTADDGYDRFSFSIRLADQANLENKTLLLCVRYNAAGQDYWDNNDNTNYQIDFAKTTTNPSQYQPKSSLGGRPRNAIPRSRHSPPTSRGRARAPSIDDDMARADSGSAYHFSSSAKDILGEDSQATIKLKPRTKRVSVFPGAPAQQAGGLGGRYDFGASLSAALSNAQDKLGKQSGLMQHRDTQKASSTDYFPKDGTRSAGSLPTSEVAKQQVESAGTDRPAIGSAQYKDLVSKFCYFTPPSTTVGKLSPQPAQAEKTPANNDGAGDSDSYNSSGSSTPTPRAGMPASLDGTNEKEYSFKQYRPYTSGTDSPVRMTRSTKGSRAHSPANYGYPYGHRDGYFPDTPAPTAILG